MILNENQPFASPNEALEHFGIKGMRWGVRKERGKAFVEAQTFGKPYDHAMGLGHGSKIFDLRAPHKLRAEERDGIIDVRPKKGFRSKRAEQYHDEMMQGIVEMRKEYPALREMKIEIVPMSHQPSGGRMMTWMGVPAAAAHLKEGEVRLYYNDRMRGSMDQMSLQAREMQPGLQTPGFLGRHEMGHVMAMAPGGPMRSGWETTHNGTNKQLEDEHASINQGHKDLLQKHGLSFEDVAKLSPYAATEPAEAFAELAAYYHTPSLKGQMSPSTIVKAQALFDDLGGKNR